MTSTFGSGLPPPDAIFTDTLMAILDYAVEAGRQARATATLKRTGLETSRRHDLQPGADTPMWNHLRERLIRRLDKRGARAVLARELNLPRQRVTEFLRRGSAMPDAERTLMLVAWLIRAEQAARVPSTPAPDSL